MASAAAVSATGLGLCAAAVVLCGKAPLQPEPEPEPEPEPAAKSRRSMGAGSVSAALADGHAIVDGTIKKSVEEPQQHAVADFLASMPPGFLDDLFPKIKAAFSPHTVKYNNTNAYIKADDASKSGTGGTQEQVEWKVRRYPHTPTPPPPPHPPTSPRAQTILRELRRKRELSGEFVHGAGSKPRRADAEAGRLQPRASQRVPPDARGVRRSVLRLVSQQEGSGLDPQAGTTAVVHHKVPGEPRRIGGIAAAY